MSTLRKPTGLIGPDPPDERDLEYDKKKEPLRSNQLPRSFPKMLDFLTPIVLQVYGDCTSMGGRATKESQETEEMGKTWQASNKWLYHFIKVISGNWDTQGDYTRNTMKALEKYGIVPLEKWPYEPKDNWKKFVKEEPPQELHDLATKFGIKSYAKVPAKINSFRSAVYRETSSMPVSMKWYDSYYDIGDDGILPEPTGKSGGHQVAYYTWIWDEDLGEPKQVFRNSHGGDFGDEGLFYIPFSQWDMHEIWGGWISTDLDNSIIKKMFKLYRDPDYTREVYAIKDDEAHKVTNRRTLWRGSDKNKNTALKLWSWDWGDKIPVANPDEFDEYVLGDEICLLTPDSDVSEKNITIGTVHFEDGTGGGVPREQL